MKIKVIFWYCDCYGPNCIKLSIEKNPYIDGKYVVGIDPINENKLFVSFGVLIPNKNDEYIFKNLTIKLNFRNFILELRLFLEV